MMLDRTFLVRTSEREQILIAQLDGPRERKIVVYA